MRFFKTLLIVAIMAISPILAGAQQTGYFSKSLQFNGETRVFHCYVPTDYSETKSYGILVALHGAGDNSQNYSAVLVNQGKWNNILPNTIFIFPDGGNDPAKDFLSPEGDEQFIFDAIDYIKDNYTIDDENIILQGFSLGGRSALKIGLDNFDYFKGLLLHTPAIQGIHDLNNTEFFKYENASKIPTVMFWGDEDLTYWIVCDSLYHKLIDRNGIVIGGGIHGLAHSITPNNITSQALLYLANPYSNEIAEALGVQIVKIDLPFVTCESNPKPKVVFRSLKAEPISKVTFAVSMNNSNYEATYTWNGTANPYEKMVFELGEVPLKDNEFEVYVTVTDIDGDDAGASMDFSGLFFKNAGMDLPFVTDFDDDNFYTFWQYLPSGNNFSWMSSDWMFTNIPNNSLFAFNTILLFNNIGVSESVISPALNLTQAEEPVLTFDLAFAYHNWGQPYFEESFSLSDTLEILISEDCDDDYQTLFRKSGSELLTISSPISNPVTLDEGLFIPTKKDWKSFSVDLSEYKTSKFARIKLKYISGLGGCIFVDNIAVAQKGFVGVEEEQTFDIALYPNPATEFIIFSSEELAQEINIYDISGKRVYSSSSLIGITDLRIDVSAFTAGAYIFEARRGNKTEVRKFLVSGK